VSLRPILAEVVVSELKLTKVVALLTPNLADVSIA